MINSDAPRQPDTRGRAYQFRKGTRWGGTGAGLEGEGWRGVVSEWEGEG